MKSISNTLDLLNHAIGFITKHQVVSNQVDEVLKKPIGLLQLLTSLRNEITTEAEQARTA